MCGGTWTACWSYLRAAGLSPRVRGNPTLATCRAGVQRSIPACAGEPTAWSITCALETVYPRVCGGTIDLIRATGDTVGLSPRVRGNLRTLSTMSGLSPRVRGNLTTPDTDKKSIPACPGPRPANVRSIPACAGERYELPAEQRSTCGGTPVLVIQVDTLDGLSPRVRGNPHGNSDWTLSTMSVYPRVCGGTSMSETFRPGSIPACAGVTDGKDVRRLALRSIPACAGEPWWARRRSYRAHGLSPRVRGNQNNVGASGTYIPACAGESRNHSSARVDTGLSPRVRGNHQRLDRDQTTGL